MLRKSLDHKIFKKGCPTPKTNKTPTDQKDRTVPVCFFHKNSYMKWVFLPNEPLYFLVP